MSGFAALLKLSKTQTEQSELEVQTQIANRQVQLEKKRREQEAKERKERELEAKLRTRRFEEERREEERKRKREEEESLRQRELAKREEQMRHALKYGPRKAAAAASGSSKATAADRGEGLGLTREELRKRQSDASEPSILTREEKRERRLAAELRRTSSTSSRRTSGGSKAITSLPDGRTVRRLPGGAVDYATVSRLDPDAPSVLPAGDLAGKSARERLAALPSTLLKLNTVKRDTRTIDEILNDRAKAKQAKVLAGDEAKEFSDWFGKNKKKEKAASQQAFLTQPTSTTSSRAVSATPSGSPSPAVNPFASATSKTKPATLATPSKSASPFLKPINPKPSSISRPATAAFSVSSSKKRPRSPSDTEMSRPSVKRRTSNASRPAAPTARPGTAPSRPTAPATTSRSIALPSDVVDISTQIWSIFGKDKKSYTARDVLSDDEDMEADAQSVLKEEARSARLAFKEDESALAEERRHEEEKRRRRKERERRERAT